MALIICGWQWGQQQECNVKVTMMYLIIINNTNNNKRDNTTEPEVARIILLPTSNIEMRTTIATKIATKRR